MQVFNVGVLELLLILIIAFIVLGPAKTIKTMGDIGRWFKNLSNSPIWREILSASKDIRDLPRKIMDDANFQNTFEELERSTKELNQVLNQVQSETEDELSEIDDNLEADLRKINEDI